MLELNKIYCGDCLDLMKEIPDKSIDLVLTDPPYGLGDKLSIGGGTKGCAKKMMELYKCSNWKDIKPNKRYFDEIFRISKNQMIFGGNYFDLPPCRGFICWDKVRAVKNFSEVEFCWTSFEYPSRIFRFCNNGGFVKTRENFPYHPTQKPVELIKWCLLNYSECGQTILDPFAGSCTTAVACIKTGRNFICIEKEPEYCKIGEKRIAALPNTKLQDWFE